MVVCLWHSSVGFMNVAPILAKTSLTRLEILCHDTKLDCKEEGDLKEVEERIFFF